LSQDRLNLADFTPAMIARPQIRRLLTLTSMAARTSEEELAAKGGRLPHKVVVRLNDDTELKPERLHARGSISMTPIAFRSFRIAARPGSEPTRRRNSTAPLVGWTSRPISIFSRRCWPDASRQDALSKFRPPDIASFYY
jgi:hypothetical protein